MVDRIIWHFGAALPTRFVVRWYRYNPADDIIERPEIIAKDFIVIYWKRKYGRRKTVSKSLKIIKDVRKNIFKTIPFQEITNYCEPSSNLLSVEVYGLVPVAAALVPDKDAVNLTKLESRTLANRLNYFATRFAISRYPPEVESDK